MQNLHQLLGKEQLILHKEEERMLDGSYVDEKTLVVTSILAANFSPALLKLLAGVLQTASMTKISAVVLKVQLKTFSGISSIPAGAKEYSVWRVHARQLVEDDSIPENIKRRKIIVSLLPPALHTALEQGKVSEKDFFFAVLETPYGNVASVSEMKVKFYETCQHINEPPSAYLNCLHALAITEEDFKLYVWEQFL